ncbi:MAG TPA: LLM class flavin-dependent oxidoreductase [Xanthobacteraceae bacterium]|nr:LLM class flavin-dependent oxidoreductase [Xanthobacteraceae bacterium]
MRFGLFGSAQAKRGGPEIDSSEGFRDFVEYNVEAEALGFYSTFLVEHHFTGFGQVSATLNLLTWVAARTKTLRVGTAVIVLPWHNPVLLAEQAATVDLLSGGRLDFGVGKGYRHNEFHSFGMSMEEGEARFREGLDLLLRSWTSQERFDYRGQFWTFNDIVVEPPTAQKPHPPIWMGASSEKSIKEVAARGFKLLLEQYATPEEIAQRIALYRSEVERHGRVFDPMDVGVARAFYVTSDAEDKKTALERRLQGRLRQLDVAIKQGVNDNNRRALSYADTAALNEASAMYGTPDEVIEKLEALRSVGVGYVLLNGGGSGGGERGRQSLRRFAREVMPALADKPALKVAG